jgi:hypothetical protein
VSPILNDETLYEMLKDRADLRRFQMSIGSTDAMPELYLASSSDSDSNSNASSIGDDKALDKLFDEATQGKIDLDEVMLSATHAGKTKGVDATHLSKMWQIDLKTAEGTLEQQAS